MDAAPYVDWEIGSGCCRLSMVSLILMVVMLVFLATNAFSELNTMESKRQKLINTINLQLKVSSQLVKDLLLCKNSKEAVVGLLENRSVLGAMSPAEVGEILRDSIRGLISLIKLMNNSVLASEAPIQILYEKHMLEKDTAIAFHTIDDTHKAVLLSTASILEEYFLQAIENKDGPAEAGPSEPKKTK